MKHTKTNVNSQVSGKYSKPMPTPEMPSKPTKQKGNTESDVTNSNFNTGAEVAASQNLLKKQFKKYKRENKDILLQDKGKAMIGKGFFIHKDEDVYRVGFCGWDAVAEGFKSAGKNRNDVSFLKVLAPNSRRKAGGDEVGGGGISGEVGGFDVEYCDANYIAIEEAVREKGATLAPNQSHIVVVSIPTENGEKYFSAIATKDKDYELSLYFLSHLDNIKEDLLSINRNACKHDMASSGNDDYRIEIKYLNASQELTYNEDSSGPAAVFCGLELDNALKNHRFKSDLVKTGTFIENETKSRSDAWVYDFILPPQIAKYIEDDLVDEHNFADGQAYIGNAADGVATGLAGNAVGGAQQNTTIKDFIKANSVGAQNLSIQNKGALLLCNVMSGVEVGDYKTQFFTPPRPLPKPPIKDGDAGEATYEPVVGDVVGDVVDGGTSQVVLKPASRKISRSLSTRAIFGVDRVNGSVLIGKSADYLTVDPIKAAVKVDDRSLLDCPVENDTQYAEICSALSWRARSKSDVVPLHPNTLFNYSYSGQIMAAENQDIEEESAKAEDALKKRVEEYERFQTSKTATDPKSGEVRNNFALNLKEYKSRNLSSPKPTIDSDEDYRIAKAVKIISKDRMSDMGAVGGAVYKAMFRVGLKPDPILAMCDEIDKYESTGIYKVKSKEDRDSERIELHNQLKLKNEALAQQRSKAAKQSFDSCIKDYIPPYIPPFARSDVKKNPLLLRFETPELDDGKQIDRAYDAIGHNFGVSRADFLDKLKSVAAGDVSVELPTRDSRKKQNMVSKFTRSNRNGVGGMGLPL